MYLTKTLRELVDQPPAERLTRRYEKFRRMGQFMEQGVVQGQWSGVSGQESVVSGQESGVSAVDRGTDRNIQGAGPEGSRAEAELPEA
jgi:acetyl-CoA carboxylase alpha subunit